MCVCHDLLGARALSSLPFAQYGQDTGNPAATFHEVRVWREQYEPEGKPLVPLRMVRVVVGGRATSVPATARAFTSDVSVIADSVG